MISRERIAGRVRSAVPALVAVCAALVPADAHARACNDFEIVIPQGSGTIACSAQTCTETNTYAPIPGCAIAFGSPVPTPGRDLLYTVLLPAGIALDVIAIPGGNWDVALYALSSDDPAEASSSCIDGVDAAFNGGEEVLRNLFNTGATTDTLYIIVDSASTSSKFGCGALDLEFRHRPVVGGVGNTCDEPLVVEWQDDAFTTEVSTCASANSYDLAGSKCLPAFADTLAGRDIVFSVTVDDSTAWMVEAVPTTDWDPALVVSASCTDFTEACIAAVDDGRVGEAERSPLILNEDGAGARTYYVLVDSWLGTSNPEGCGTVEMRFTRMPFGGTTGESCAGPIPLTFDGDPISVTGFTCGFEDDLDAAAECASARGSSFPGRDVVYAVAVNTDQWSVSVTPMGSWDVALGVLQSCAIGCVAVTDVGDAGVGESLATLTNPTPGTIYYVSVDSRIAPGNPEGCGGYRLRVSESGVVPTQATSWGALKSRFRTK